MKRNGSRSRANYQQVDMSDHTDEESDVRSKYSTDNNSTIDDIKQKKSKTFFQWMLDKPLSKMPFLYFVIGFLGSIGNAVFYFMDNDTGFIICGIIGLSVSFFAIKHFYTLLGLKKEVDVFSQNNLKFQKEHGMLRREVDRIEHANTNLRETRDRLVGCIEKNRENLDNFREIEKNMEAFGKQSLAEIEDIQLKSKAIENKWHDQLLGHQRNLLNTVFDRYERQGSREGMTAEEFKEFEKHLPQDYQDRFARMGTFNKLSGGQSVIEYEDFKATLDIFAEMATDDVDIEFEIDKKPKPSPSRKKTKRPKNIKFTKMGELKEDEAENDNTFGPEMSKAPDMALTLSISSPLGDLDKLQEVESIDLKDIKFDEQEDDTPVTYERSIRVTKRTERSKRFQDMGLSLFSGDDDDDDHDASSSDHDAAAESMFGRQEEPEQQGSPGTPGIVLKKEFFKVPEHGRNVSLKSMGRKKFADLLDDTGSD